MALSSLTFNIATADVLKITDTEITALLTQVYVGGGFTTPDEAASLFEPSAVRRRGILIGGREKTSQALAGMIIVVPPDSPARRLIESRGAELHLLGVKPEYRRHGLGRLLIQAAIEQAIYLNFRKVSLWTQVTMTSAQKLYELSGFVHVRNLEKNGRQFKVYERGSVA